jgi:hypothetical protein
MQPVTEDMLQDQEVTIMKLRAISIAIVMAGFAGVAAAGQPSGTMQPLNVTGSAAECAPPNDRTGRACDDFSQLVRANFSAREIGMLFGASTSYPESLTGGLERLQKRYQALLQGYVAQRNLAKQQTAIE